MWWRSPPVLAIGASFISFASTAAHAAQSVRLLRVAVDTNAVVVRDGDAHLHVVRVGERVMGSAWSLQSIRTGGATFAYGSAGNSGGLMVDVPAGRTLDLSRKPADLEPTPHPAAVSTHVVTREEDKRDAP